MDSSVLTVVAMVALLSLSILAGAWQFITLVVEINKFSNNRKLKEDLEKSITNGSPSWTQVKIIASTYSLLPENSLNSNLKKILKGYVIGGSEGNEKQIKLLEEWLEKQSSDEPFDGIPSELKLPLERIRKEVPDQAHNLELLVAQLQDFTEKSAADKRRKNLVAILSLLVGIGGFLVGLYQVYDSKYQPEEPNRVAGGI